MTENQRSMDCEGLEKEIIEKAQSDKDFKKALLDNPKETLIQIGVQVPDEVEVKVVEESAKVVYLVLPVNPDELTDEQLDGVAGGSEYGLYGHLPGKLDDLTFRGIPIACAGFNGKSFWLGDGVCGGVLGAKLLR